MVYKFFDKKTSGSGIENDHFSHLQLAEELHNPIIRNFNKRKYIHIYRQYLGY